MHIRKSLGSLLLTLSVFLLGAAPAQAAGEFIFNHSSHGISTENGNVIITNSEKHEATITPAGRLTIDSKSIDVSPDVTQELKRYVTTVTDIEQLGKEIGLAGGQLAVDAIGSIFTALFEGSDQAEQKIKKKAAPIKQKARELCKKVRLLELLQDHISTAEPAFRPFAVLDQQADDCTVDD